MPEGAAPPAVAPARPGWRVISRRPVDPLAAVRPAPIAAEPRSGKAIVICCDGTANDRAQMQDGLPAATNVFRLYDALTEDALFKTLQVTWYDEGVGTGTSGAAKKAGFFARIAQKLGSFLPDWFADFADKFLRALESATGAWIEENIEQGYREIVRNYEPGDQIFIFGFSRGAYTARCIAGVIDRCGLLKSENIRFTEDAVLLYRRRKSGLRHPVLKEDLIHPRDEVRVCVLGLWDTVASLGLPLWGWWFRLGAFWRNKSLDSNPASICRHVYHAMSMDEQRSQFFPTVTTPGAPGQVVRQVWFRGVHADVGGGYGNRSLGDIGLEWMLQIARHHGLLIRPDYAGLGEMNGQPICPKAEPMGKMHDEIKSRPGWIVFGSWPRWAPVPRPEWTDRFQAAMVDCFGVPHDWVYHRAQAAAACWRQRGAADAGRIDSLLARDGLVFLDFNRAMTVGIAAATVWNRTGIVFESGAIYKVAYAGGRWRDKEKPECGPAGQKPKGHDLIRRLAWRSKRLLGADWLELIGHVAHPRPWPIAEFGFRTLLKLFFWREPIPLARSLMRLGRHMAHEGDWVYIVNLASNGIFNAFGNDTWATYKNNSGALDLTIERVVGIPADQPCFVVTPRGEVIERSADDQPVGALIELVTERARLLRDHGLPSWPELTPGMADPAAPAGASPDAAALYAFADLVPGTPAVPPQPVPEIEAIEREIERRLAAMAGIAETKIGLLARMRAMMVRFTRTARALKVPAGAPAAAVPRDRAAWSSGWERSEV